MADDDTVIEGDVDAWFSMLEAGEFAKQWKRVQWAIADERQRNHEDLSREPQISGQWSTHATLDPSED